MDTPLFTVLQSKDAPETGDARRYERLFVTGPVALLIGKGLGAKRISGQVLNASGNGMLVAVDPSVTLQADDPVRIDWHVPLHFGEPAGGQHLRVHGHILRRASHREKPVLAIKFDAPLIEQAIQRSGRWWRALMGLLAVITGILIIIPARQNYLWFWYLPYFQAYSLLFVSYLMFRIVLCFFYKPPPDRGYMPKVTVVIPVKNEERRISETLAHCFASHYPADRLEAIVIDDGSTDETWAVLESLKDRYANLRLFRFSENHGKHHAMALGARQASGDILIFVDSDSLVGPESIYRIVQPFTDPAVGAVAGHVLVAMPPFHFISRMESVHYFLSHRINKAAESLFGSVTCCPGAFSAYRRDLIIQVLPAWLKNTFLGGKVMLGDDRSLTNCVLRTHQVLYHHQATARTYVPATWSQFFRQQLRWKKSWLQETRIAMRLMIHRHPVMVLTYYAEIILTLVSPLVMSYMLFVLPFIVPFNVGPYLLSITLLYVFFGLFHRSQMNNSFWYFSIVLMPFYLTILSWQNYYAILTIHRSRWSTR